FLSDQLAVKVWAAEHSLFAKQDRLIWSALVAAENGDSDGVIDSLVSLGAFINQTSLCLQLQVGPTSVALTGDLSAATWAQFAMLPCSIIKLPHHGHKDSLSTDLIERLCPRYAVISVSHDRKDNRPHTSILALLKDHGVATLFTDAVDRPGFLRHRHQAVRFYLTEKGIDGVYFVTGHNQIELVFNEG
ncbi:MAG TPA: hypothetical protein GX717_07095, partial [Clostridiaceae bacterium]|nr:hypothetical protein [Clostridiaceae bacterium]